MDVLAQGWLSDNKIQTNETYDAIDPVDVIKKMFAMQDAIYMELYPEVFEQLEAEQSESAEEPEA